MKFNGIDFGAFSDKELIEICLKYDLIDKKLLSSKSCYIGRLDPMARGNMLFLENKD